MRDLNETTMKREKQEGLENLRFSGIESSTAEIPRVISEIIHPEDDIFRAELESTGTIIAPRTIAAVAAAGHQALIASIASRDPAVGFAIVYGGIVCGDTQQMATAYDAVYEVFDRDVNGEQEPFLSVEQKSLLLAFAVRAAELRKPGELGKGYRDEESVKYHRDMTAKLSRFIQASGLLEEGCSLDPSIEAQFPEFKKLREMIDVIRASMLDGALPPEKFFADTQPNVENYLKATYACTSLAGSPLQMCGIEFLGRVDAPLLRVFRAIVIGGGMGRSIPL